MSSPNPEQELELIASTAALYRPQQIYGKVALLLRALLFQHECVIGDLCDVIEEDDKALGSFHAFAQDVRSLELMLVILKSIEPNFLRASEQAVQDLLKLSKEELTKDQDVETTRQNLENLLKDI